MPWPQILVAMSLLTACSGFVRPLQARHNRVTAVLHARHHGVCASADDAQRRRDEDARRKELDGGGSELVDADMSTLREYIGIVKDKEDNLEDIKGMLRTMQATVGVPLVGDDGAILGAAWVFVGLNVALAAYLAYGLLLAPLQRSIEAFG